MFDSQSLVCSKGEIETKVKTILEFQAIWNFTFLTLNPCVFEGGNRENKVVSSYALFKYIHKMLRSWAIYCSIDRFDFPSIAPLYIHLNDFNYRIHGKLKGGNLFIQSDYLKIIMCVFFDEIIRLIQLFSFLKRI